MNFLSGQDDFFQTGNEPISVRHLSQPYNKYRLSHEGRCDISSIGMISYIRHVRRAHIECDNLFIMCIFVPLSGLEKSKRVKRFWFLSLLSIFRLETS